MDFSLAKFPDSSQGGVRGTLWREAKESKYPPSEPSSGKMKKYRTLKR
jgi:hypothetical protein